MSQKRHYLYKRWGERKRKQTLQSVRTVHQILAPNANTEFILNYNINQHLYEIIPKHLHVHHSLPYRIACSISHDQLWGVLSFHPSLPIHLPGRLFRGAVPWWRIAFLLSPSLQLPSTLCFLRRMLFLSSWLDFPGETKHIDYSKRPYLQPFLSC